MTEITSMAELQQLVAAGETDWRQYGEVAVQEADGLILFNYTPLAQYQGRWNWFERVSRGLILNRETGEVVARPFDKFFNWGEGGRYPVPDAYPVRVQEKVDGSLGIVYEWRGEVHVATRGSFSSPQARWATAWWRENVCKPTWDDATLLVEIVYPENRIVVDYGDWSGLVLLNARHKETGYYVMDMKPLRLWAHGTPIRVASEARFTSPQAIIDYLPKLTNVEGFVAEFSDGTRWKFKTEEYRMLHKLVTGLSFQSVLEAMKEGREAEMLNVLPSRLRWQATAWMHETEKVVHEINATAAQFMALLPSGLERKEVASRVGTYWPELRRYLFLAYDGKPLRPAILKNEFRDRRDRLMTGGE